MVPVVLLAVLLVVQFSLAYYARQVLAGAAHDGAVAGARLDSSPEVGASLTRNLIDGAAGSLLESHTTTASTVGEVVTVTATGQVVSLLPFIGTIRVSATGTARVERFAPQGSGP